MINSTNPTIQTVEPTQNVVFTSDRVRTNSCKPCCDGWLTHDLSSGLFTITKGGIYDISFNANVANPTTAAEILFNITNSGESIIGGQMIVTPAAAGAYFNISARVLIRVPCRSSAIISIKNNSTAEVLVSQPNIVITRQA